jgi:hypothetical protein
MGQTLNEGVRKVLRKIRKDQRMDAAVELMDGARWRVKELWRRKFVETGSKMRAYEDVAAMVGRSPSWIEKLIGRRLDTKRPDAVALMNIHAVYSRICEKVEATAERFENAAPKSTHPTVPSVAEKPPVGNDDLTIPAFLRRTD